MRSIEKRSRPTFVLLGILLASAILGVGRMKWSARTGSEELATSWHTLDKATLGLVLDRRTPAESLPAEQLEFWAGEAERILAVHPDDAELYAAAAVMLDHPCLTYVSELLSDSKSIQSNSPWDTHDSVQDVMEKSRASFDIDCIPLVANYARQATEREPDDVRWWRIRAALLWPGPLSTQYFQPREPQWKETLEAARQHDPGNALYDMIELVRTGSDTYRFEDGEMVLDDLDAWRRCIELAERIGKASHLTLGEPAMPGLLRLHDLSRHPKATTQESIRHRMLGQRGALIANRSSRELIDMSEVIGDLPDDISRLELIELATAINDLAANRSDVTVRNDNLTQHMRLIVWEIREALESASGDVSEQTEQGLEAATDSYTSFLTRANAFNAPKVSPVSPVHSLLSGVSLSLLPVGIACSLGWLVMWGAATYRNTPRGRRWRELQLSPLALLLAALAFCVSYFFWGVGPANAVSENAQHWVFTVLSFVLLLTVLGGMAIRMRFRWRFSIRSLMILSVVAAVALQVVFHWQLGWQWLGFPIRVAASPSNLLGQYMQQNSTGLGDGIPGPGWTGHSVIQWLGNGGAKYAGMIFVLLSLITCLWQSSFRQASGKRFVTSVAVTLAMWNLWVWTEPKVYQSTRPQQQRIEQYIRSVDEYYSPFHL